MKKPDVSVVSAATVRHTGVHFWAGKGCHHESYDFNSAPPPHGGPALSPDSCLNSIQETIFLIQVELISTRFPLPSKGQGQNCMWKSDITYELGWDGRAEMLEASQMSLSSRFVCLSPPPSQK